MVDNRSDDTPDFARLYDRRPLSPRMAGQIWVMAIAASDDFRSDMEAFWLAQLPLVARPHVDERFVGAFGGRFELLASRLAGGLTELTDLTTCTADEVALHLIIDRAEEIAEEGGFDLDWIEALPRQPADHDFYGVKDYLFYDLDVLHLFDPAMDGVEDPESEVARVERFVNLHPRDWFEAFAK